MEVGTTEIIDEIRELKKRRSGLSGGGNGGGRDPGGGGGSYESEENGFEAETFVMVTMTFGGLIAAYVVLATNNVAEWRPFALPVQLWISTVIILISSITYHLAKMAVDRNNQPSAKKWFVATTVLGAAFISSQMLAWFELTARGLYVQGNPYAGFFYILTAVHAVHVLGGIMALGAILLKSWNPTERPVEIARRQTLAHVVGWYWHFMGGLWLVLFVLLGFWK